MVRMSIREDQSYDKFAIIICKELICFHFFIQPQCDLLIAGSSETLVMDMPKLVISILTNVKERDPLASEVFMLCLHLNLLGC